MACVFVRVDRVAEFVNSTPKKNLDRICTDLYESA